MSKLEWVLYTAAQYRKLGEPVPEIRWKVIFHRGTSWGHEIDTESIIFFAPANIRAALTIAERLLPEGTEIEDLGVM